MARATPRIQIRPGTEAAAERLVLERFVPYRLSILSNRVSRAIAARYAKAFDLTIPEWRVIAVLGRRPGLTALQDGFPTIKAEMATWLFSAVTDNTRAIQERFDLFCERDCL